jgi:hypothetical protein
MMFLSEHQMGWLRLGHQIEISMSTGVVESSVLGLQQQEMVSKLRHQRVPAVGKRVMVMYQAHLAVGLLPNTNHHLMTRAEQIILIANQNL